MKKIVFSRLCLFAMVFVSQSRHVSIAAADEPATFPELLKRFYFIDEAPAKEIRCFIEAPALSEMIKRLSGVPPKILKTTENLKDFEVVLKDKAPLRIIEPTLQLDVVSYDEVADKATFDEGMENVKRGFAMTVGGVRGMVEGIFAELIRPTSEELAAAKLTKSGEGFSATLTRGKVTVTHSYRDGKRFSKLSGGEYDKDITTEYTKVGGKDAVARISTVSRLAGKPEIASTETINIVYVDVDRIPLPSKFLSAATLGPPGALSASTEVNLTRCTVKR